MGYSVRIYKERETETQIIYRFGIDEKQMGRLSLRKADGYVEELIPAPHPQARAIFVRAMHKLLDHWGRGELPDMTYWLNEEGFSS